MLARDGPPSGSGKLHIAAAAHISRRMSVAFTKESDAEAQAADLPDRPIPAHPNLVTPKGLAQIDAELARPAPPMPQRRPMPASAPTAPPWPAPPATCAIGPPAAPAPS